MSKNLLMLDSSTSQHYVCISFNFFPHPFASLLTCKLSLLNEKAANSVLSCCSSHFTFITDDVSFELRRQRKVNYSGWWYSVFKRQREAKAVKKFLQAKMVAQNGHTFCATSMYPLVWGTEMLSI